MNWYYTYKIESNLQKEAGLKERLGLALITAVVSVVAGYLTIQNAAKKHNVPEEKIEQTIANKELMDDIRSKILKNYNFDITTQKPKEKKEVVQKPKEKKEVVQKTTTLNEILPYIIEHEGLIPYQTPFRITNPIMKKWNYIHGYKIDKNFKKPSNRTNFIFLKNKEDVSKAIKKQFLNYIDNPSRYNLKENPTIEDIIRKFDQDKPDSKMEHIKNAFPNIDFSKPAKSLI